VCRTSRVWATFGPAPTVLRSTAETCSLRCISDKKPDDNRKKYHIHICDQITLQKTLYTLCRMYNALRYTIYTIQRRRTLYMVYTHFIMSESHCPQCDCLLASACVGTWDQHRPLENCKAECQTFVIR
jgi:hypothetical protein